MNSDLPRSWIGVLAVEYAVRGRWAVSRSFGVGIGRQGRVVREVRTMDEQICCDFCGTVGEREAMVRLENGLDICHECVTEAKRGEEGSHRLSKQALEEIPC